MKKTNAFRIAITALFASLICVATMLVQIPIPATGGYANLGDGVILICAFLMTPLHAVMAAGLGSLLADVLAGYASYAVGSLAIKAVSALLASAVYHYLNRRPAARHSRAAMAAAGILAEAAMVLGYFLYEAFILGMGMGAAGGVIGNICQGTAGILIACMIAPALLRSDEIAEMMRKM